MKKTLLGSFFIATTSFFGQSNSSLFYNVDPSLIKNTHAARMATVNPACTNMDFETGNATGWTINSGTTLAFGNSCNPASFTTASTTFSILNNGYIDPFMPTMPINSQFGSTGNGNNFLKVNDQLAGGNQQQLSQSFSVTTSNNLFKFAYMYVTDLGGHPNCCDQPYFRVRFLNSLNQPQSLLLTSFTVMPSFSCNPTYSQTVAGMTVCPGNANFLYTPWIHGAADLTPFIGSYVTFELSVGDCSSAGHPSYCYFDSKCAPLTYSVNGNSAQLDSTNNFCASTLPMTLTAPSGFQNYAWTGPNSSSTQSVSVTAFGSYTLTMNALATCCPIKKIFNITACTSLNEEIDNFSNIRLYPNPSKDIVTIDNAPSNSEFEVYDIYGKIVLSRNLLPNDRSVHLSQLSSGVYFIKLLDQKGTSVQFKIIKE